MEKEIPNLKNSFLLFKRLVLLIKPYWIKLIKVMVLGIIISLVSMASPYMTKLLIDTVYPAQDITLMHVIVAGMLTVSVVSTLISSIQGFFNLYITTKLSNSTGLLFYNHLQHLKISFFDSHRVGEVMSRFGDVNQSLNSVNKVFQTFFVNGIYLIFVPPFLFMLQWKLALIALVSIPLTIIIISVTGKFLRKYWKKTSEAYAELNAFQFEMLTHIHAVKAMVLEHYVYKENRKQLEEASRLHLKAGGLGQILGLSNGLLNGLNTILFTWFGWTFILSGEMSLGDYIAFTAYISYLYRPLLEIVNLFSDFQHSAINLGRMYEYLDKDTEIDPKDSYAPIKKINHIIKGNISVHDLSFGYSNEITVLDGINLQINSGSVVSIVGPSGSGKTSLLRLLIGLERPRKGEILFDNIPLNNLPLQQLRKQVTVIWQEFSMFKGTIRDNLTIGTEDLDEKSIRKAIELSRMDNLIDSLPEGLNTPIAEWGNSLSGGQKQRLAIARALIRNTPVIILDEATSNIDLKTEADIMFNVFQQFSDKTILYVTHRLSTAALADKICFIESGKIIDYGSHNDLINRCESYKNMYGKDSGNSSVLIQKPDGRI